MALNSVLLSSIPSCDISTYYSIALSWIFVENDQIYYTMALNPDITENLSVQVTL